MVRRSSKFHPTDRQTCDWHRVAAVRSLRGSVRDKLAGSSDSASHTLARRLLEVDPLTAPDTVDLLRTDVIITPSKVTTRTAQRR